MVRDSNWPSRGGRATMTAMRSHAEYCPIAKAAETLGDRWSLLIIRELLFDVGHFNELERNLPGISRSVLAERLRQLVSAGVVERSVGGDGRTTTYRLTRSGRELREVVHVLGDWAARWVIREPGPDELDPDLLMLWLSRHVNRRRLPLGRVVVEFELRDPARSRYWLVLERDGASLCRRHPGFESDLMVEADVATLYRVYMGRLALQEAIGRGEVRVDGPPRLVRAMPGWFGESRYAAAVRNGLRLRAMSLPA